LSASGEGGIESGGEGLAGEEGGEVVLLF
jgi:hypothetical protein